MFAGAIPTPPSSWGGAGYSIFPEAAVDEGMISPDDDLLLPKFYLVGELEEWLLETVKTWMADRPHWMI